MTQELERWHTPIGADQSLWARWHRGDFCWRDLWRRIFYKLGDWVKHP